jgi:type I restriction enzyme S subunit
MVSKLNRVTSLNDFVSSDAPICYGILKPGEHIPTGIPVIKVKNIKNGAILTKDLLHTSIEIDKQYSRSKLKTGDILLTIRGSTGRVAIVPKSLNGSNITQDTARIRVSTSDDLTYLFYALHAPKTQQQINLNTVGQAVKGINISEVKKLKIYHPPLPEQRKIAQILSTWDRGIATTEKLIDASKQQKKALMQQLLTGKKRLIDPETGKAFEGECEITSISQLITESRLAGTNGELAKKITVKLYGRGVTKKEEKRLGSESTKYYKRKSGQFIYSKLDFLNGAFGIIPQSLDGYESTLDLPAFDFTPNVIPKWFIEFVSRDDFYTSNLGLANGGRKARRVNPKDLLQVKVRLPSLTEQQKITSVLTAADKEIELLAAKFTHLKQEKKALMQQLLTGKRRVSLSS